MILRKPYAFFIKFFKTFHLIIFALSSILLYRTSLVYNFMKEFCKDSPNVIGKDLVGPLFVPWVYILIIVILLVNILIIFIMIRKVKPYAYYVFNIALYIGVLVIYFVSRGVIGDMQTMLVAPRTTLAIRDFLNLARLLETVSVIFYLIRATGFDIKKFDFVRDLQGMDISEEDSEEIEVSLEFEKNVFIRKFKKYLRDFKYYYKENKFVLNIVFIFIIGIVCLIVYFSYNKYDKVYTENEFFNVSGYNIGVLNTSIVTKDYRGNKIVDDDSILVVVKTSLNSDLSSSISNSRAILVVDGIQYYSSTSYSSYLNDLGTVYNGESLSSDFSDYLFVYKLPKSSISSNMYFRYVDNIEYKRGKTYINSIDVKLNPINLDNDSTNYIEYSLGTDVVIDNYRVVLNSFEISSMFVNTYNSCINRNECYDFREILKASPLRDHDKVLLKINGNASYVDDLGSSINLYNFINTFGSISYTYDGKDYSSSNFYLTTASKTSENNVYYIEIDKEIMDASSIKLNFNFRNNIYSYVLRGDFSE